MQINISMECGMPTASVISKVGMAKTDVVWRFLLSDSLKR